VDPAAKPTAESQTPEQLEAAKVEAAKVEAEKAKTDDKAKAAKAEPGKVPDKYDFKAPEGGTLDEAAITEITPIFKELGLDQAQAQKLFDFAAKRDLAAAEVGRKAFDDMRAGWRGDVTKDPALGDGKDGLKPEVRANIDKAMQAIGDAKQVSAFKQAMDQTGVGDHPAFVAAFNTLGKLLSEGTLVRAGAPATTGQTAPGQAVKPSPAQAMYPKLPSSAA
jgi:hypothetical protein